MLCPLRHKIDRANSTSFEECYKEECSWWFVDSCAIQFIAFLLMEVRNAKS